MNRTCCFFCFDDVMMGEEKRHEKVEFVFANDGN